MKLHLVKQLNGTFKPAFDSDYQQAKKIRVGDCQEYETKKKRNPLFHKKMFALFNMVLQNQEVYTDINKLRSDLTIEAGYYEEHTNSFTGEVVRQAKSISYGGMDEFEFNELYNKIKDVIVIHWDWSNEDINDNINQYF